MNDVNDVNAIYTNSWTLQQAMESLALAANEIESLRARVKELEKLSEAISRDCNNTALQRNKLYEELSALKQQEP